MSILENQDLNRRSAFRLTVAGLPVRYYSGPIAPTLANVPGTGGALFYADRPDLAFVGPVRNRIKPIGGIADQGPMALEILTSTDIRNPNDPGVVFSRLTYRSSSWWGQLITPLDQLTTTINVDRSTAGVTVPGLIHIGAEAIWVTGTAGIGIPADPYRFTGATRGAAETQPQVHRVESITGKNPLVVAPEVVSWRTRRCRVEMAQIRADGTLGAWMEIKRGFIDRTPSVDGDGLRVRLEVVDQMVLLDAHLVDNQVDTTLVDGWHEFEAPWASTLQHAQRWAWQGDAWTTPTTGSAPGRINVFNGNLAGHQGTMDTTLAGRHPRRGIVWSGGDFDIATGYVTAEPPAPAGMDQFIVAAPGPAGVPPILNSAPAVEILTAEVAPGVAPGTVTLLRWPDAAVDALQASWVPRTHLGNAGAWANVAADVDGPSLLASYNCDNYNRSLRLLFYSDVRALQEHVAGDHKDWRSGLPVDPPDGFESLWYGLDMADPGSRVYPHHNLSNGRGAVRGPRLDEWAREVQVAVQADTGRQPAPPEQIIPIRGVATAFHQTGEPAFLVLDEVTVPAGGAHSLTVTYWDGGAEPIGANPIQTWPVRVTASTQVLDAGVPVGWRLTIDPRDRWRVPSFGNWPGREPAKIRSAVEFRAERPAVILLQLLLSGGGALVNDPTYDVLPIGANLTTADVDVASFLRWPDTPAMDLWTLTYPDGAAIRDVLEDMLAALGAGIVSRTDPETGARRLTLVSIGPESPMEALGAQDSATISSDGVDRVISDGDWLVEPIPSWGTDDEITNKWTFRINHSRAVDSDDEESHPVVVNDWSSINQWGDGESEELDLRGIVTDPANPGGPKAAVQSLAARLMRQFGDPRRTWVGAVPTGQAVLGHLGAVFLVGSRFLRSFGTVGISAVNEDGTAVAFNGGRVIEETIDYWGEGATYRMHHYGVNGAGWAASGEAATEPTGSSITIGANDFTPPEHPVTGETFRDINGFFAGQAVLLFPPADRDAAIALTVLSTDGISRIDFTGAHGGGVVGHILTPATYDLTVNRLYAFLADANGTLGASADPAKEIS